MALRSLPSDWLLLVPVHLHFCFHKHGCHIVQDSSKIAFRRVKAITFGYFEVVNEKVGKN